MYDITTEKGSLSLQVVFLVINNTKEITLHYLQTDNMATFLLEFRVPRHQQEHPHGQTDGWFTPTRKEIYHPLKNAFILKVKISFYISDPRNSKNLWISSFKRIYCTTFSKVSIEILQHVWYLIPLKLRPTVNYLPFSGIVFQTHVNVIRDFFLYQRSFVIG